MSAMFDSEVPNAEKAVMAWALLQHPGGRHFEEITPKLADFIAGRAQAQCLSTFITDRSWLFFHLAGKIQKSGCRGHLRNGHKTLITLSCLKLQGICL